MSRYNTVTYVLAFAAYAIDQDLIVEIDLSKGTTLEILPNDR